MQIRHAVARDLPAILDIYKYARSFMAEHGNPGQWGNGYPSDELVKRDITEQKSYVCVDNGRVGGVFFFDVGEEPTYVKIDGCWLNNEKYGVVHRIASARGTKGVATYCLDWATGQCKNLRIDTHENNIPMQSLLNKLGFSFCGIIKLADGSPRRAYQKVA